MTATSARIFVDTNVLLYLYDKTAPAKQARAQSLLAGLPPALGVISTQVMQEFYVNITRKLKYPESEAKGFLRSFLVWEVVTISPPLVLDAVDASTRYQLSF